MDFLRQALTKRRAAYRAVFQPGDKLSSAAEVVLSDLRQFCRATVSTTVVSPVSGMVDPIASGQAEGRREVFNRIRQYLDISDADMYRLVNRDNDEQSIS